MSVWLWPVLIVGITAVVLIALHQFDRRRLPQYALALAITALLLFGVLVAAGLPAEPATVPIPDARGAGG